MKETVMRRPHERRAGSWCRRVLGRRANALRMARLTRTVGWSMRRNWHQAGKHLQGQHVGRRVSSDLGRPAA